MIIDYREARDIQTGDVVIQGSIQRPVIETRTRTLADGIERVYIRTEGSRESIRHRTRFRIPVVAG